MATDDPYPQGTEQANTEQANEARRRAMARDVLRAESEHLNRQQSTLDDLARMLLDTIRELMGRRPRPGAAPFEGGPVNQGGYGPGQGGYAPGQQHTAEMSSAEALHYIREAIKRFDPGQREAFEDEVLRQLKADKQLHREFRKSPERMPLVMAIVANAESREARRNGSRGNAAASGALRDPAQSTNGTSVARGQESTTRSRAASTRQPNSTGRINARGGISKPVSGSRQVGDPRARMSGPRDGRTVDAHALNALREAKVDQLQQPAAGNTTPRVSPDQRAYDFPQSLVGPDAVRIANQQHPATTARTTQSQTPDKELGSNNPWHPTKMAARNQAPVR
ncbi:hypothetical protein ACFC09_07955 [Streptomyces sp. NPDC056161]|uniref:hypothetical protein n=1 Tax=Streptomyces sp. NPDC056161 TaxID=3345732 RepID=UPI0035DA34D0